MTYTTNPAPSSCWRTCLITLLLPLLLSGLAWGLWQHWQQADRDRRAPIIFDGQAEGCTLSPGGRYMTIGSDAFSFGDFFDTSTRNRVHVLVPPPIGRRPSPGLWLQAETFFHYTMWTKTEIGGSTVYVPQNGWLLDVANQVVTDVLTLDPAARQAVLDLAAQRDAARFTQGLPATSPDGRYFYHDIYIADAQTRAFLNIWPDYTKTAGCIPGWRLDNQGYYFVDKQPVSLFVVGPGPIRLLLVNPPPRPWTQYAPSVGAVLGLLGLIGWWWRRIQKN